MQLGVAAMAGADGDVQTGRRFLTHLPKEYRLKPSPSHTQPRAFLTGAGGFLGRHLLELLLAEGWQVHALLRGAPPPWLRPRAGLVLAQGALEDARAVRAALPEGVDALFHLAGNTSSWRGERAAILRDNLTATQTLLAAAEARGARRLLMCSTLGLFDGGPGPINEQSPWLAARQTRANPYLDSKRQAEAALDAAALRGLSVCSLHPGHLLGRHDRRGWISLFEQAAQGRLSGPAPGGQASFCSAAAVARAHLRAAELAAPARRYVLGGADARYLDCFAAVARRVGARPPRQRAPAALLRLMAALADAGARLSGRPPAITPGLARLLGASLLADDRLARRELDHQPADLAALLDETCADWRQGCR